MPRKRTVVTLQDKIKQTHKQECKHENMVHLAPMFYGGFHFLRGVMVVSSIPPPPLLPMNPKIYGSGVVGGNG